MLQPLMSRRLAPQPALLCLPDCDEAPAFCQAGASGQAGCAHYRLPALEEAVCVCCGGRGVASVNRNQLLVHVFSLRAEAGLCPQ